MSPAKDKRRNTKIAAGTRTLTINGKAQEFPAGIPKTLAELLGRLNVNQATVAAEIDGKIIERQDFALTPLSAGQSIELVRFVGGG